MPNRPLPRVIVLHTPKGGSGKSTLTREIAVMAARDDRRTAVADLDPQGTTSRWFQRRQNPEPVLVKLDLTKLRASLHSLAGRFDLLVVDTPPGSAVFMTKLLLFTRLIIVPMRPTPDDVVAAASIADTLGLNWVFLLSQVPPQTALLASAVRQLASIGRVAPVEITLRNDYPRAAIKGCTAGEQAGKAADEVAALWDYISKQIDGDSGERATNDTSTRW